MAQARFAFGTALSVLCVTYLVPVAPYPRLVALLGGVWAALPDIHRIAPAGATRLQRFHRSGLADLLRFHRTLDALDPNDQKVVAAGMLRFSSPRRRSPSAGSTARSGRSAPG